MASRTLPGIGLNGFWGYGEDNWNTGMDANLRRLSALSCLVLDSITAALPGSPTDGTITVDPAAGAAGTIKVRDLGAWFDFAPSIGWRAYIKDVARLATYTVTGWVLDAQTVNLTGNQTIANTKTFSTSPLVPKAALGDNTTKAASMSALLEGFSSRGFTNSVAVTDANAINAPGFYTLATVGNGGLNGPTELTVGYSIIHVGIGSGSFQIASPQTSGSTNKYRLWHRQQFSSIWSAWYEFADLASPALTGIPTAPTAADDTATLQLGTTAFTTNAMTRAGLLTNAVPNAADLNAITTSGIKRYTSTGVNTPVAGQSGVFLHAQYSPTYFGQLLMHLGQASPNPKLFYRVMVNSAIQSYKEVAFLDNALFTGPIRLGEYTLSTLPSASANNRCLIEVTDATGGSKTCKSNGTVWQILNTTTTVS